MKLKRTITAALVVLTLGTSAPSAFAKHHRRHVRHKRVVIVREPRGVVHSLRRGPHVIVRRAHRDVRYVGHHLNARFIPLPAPHWLPVPPPFKRF